MKKLSNKFAILIASSLLLSACGTTDVTKFESASQSLQSLSNAEMNQLVTHLQEVDQATPNGCAFNVTTQLDSAKSFSKEYTQAVNSVSAYSSALVSLAKSADNADAHAEQIADSLSSLATAANIAIPGAGTAAQTVFTKAISELAKTEVRSSLKKTLEQGQPVVNCVAEAAEKLFAPASGSSGYDPFGEFIDASVDNEIGVRRCQAGTGLIQAYEVILMHPQTNIDLEREIACLAAPRSEHCKDLTPQRSAKEITVALQLLEDQRQRYENFEASSAAATRWGGERKKNWVTLGQSWHKWAAENAALSKELTSPWPWSSPSRINLQCASSEESG